MTDCAVKHKDYAGKCPYCGMRLPSLRLPSLQATKYERIRAQYIAGLGLIPQHMHEGIIRYMENGIPGGGFITGILAHDMDYARLVADAENEQAIPEWKDFIGKHLPLEAHGSYKAVRNWCNSRGLNGQEAAEKQWQS